MLQPAASMERAAKAEINAAMFVSTEKPQLPVWMMQCDIIFTPVKAKLLDSSDTPWIDMKESVAACTISKIELSDRLLKGGYCRPGHCSSALMHLVGTTAELCVRCTFYVMWSEGRGWKTGAVKAWSKGISKHMLFNISGFINAKATKLFLKPTGRVC